VEQFLAFTYEEGLVIGFVLGMVVAGLWAVLFYEVRMASMKRQLGQLYRPRGRKYDPPLYITPTMEPRRPPRDPIPKGKL